LAYTFEAPALLHIWAKRLKRVLSSFSPTFRSSTCCFGRHNPSMKLKARIRSRVYASPCDGSTTVLAVTTCRWSTVNHVHGRP